MRNFPIHPEPEAHVLLGASMGGAAAFNVAFKHPDKFKSALGFMPALNLRWVDCHGNYNSSFDPDCWGWRSRLRPLEVAGRPKGIFTVRFHKLIGPLVGHGPDAMTKLSLFNPVEVMENYNVKPGQLNLFIAYGGKDEFNIPAQVESFLYLANQRGLKIAVEYDPNGRHDEETGRRFFAGAIDWIAPLMEKYR
jgi:S-formylglutathione hydrolase FrmB